jgi:hypothetical protein
MFCWLIQFFILQIMRHKRTFINAVLGSFLVLFSVSASNPVAAQRNKHKPNIPVIWGGMTLDVPTFQPIPWG